jgi:tRNA nucleotidyltransferase (CCA-adding enzyme)
MALSSRSEIVPPDLARILNETPALHTAYLVGGCVRDWLLGHVIKDYDIEVFGLSYEQLVTALQRWGKTDLVGRSFGVVKLAVPGRNTVDFTIARRDSKVAPGHKGFEISFDPAIGPREAAARRDFTINALMYDPRRKELLDFFDGEKDLREGVLRYTSPAFREDPLRVLRGMQFAGRFNLRADSSTIGLCRSMAGSFSELAVERVREEWLKWAAKSTVPSAGLQFLVATNWIEHFPEIAGMRGTPQEPAWHPEGDVFVHTCHCCDALVKLPEWQEADEETRVVLSFAILTHDFGKTVTTRESVEDGQTRIVSPGHEEASTTLAETFLGRFRAPLAIVERVIPLVRNHMAHMQEVTDRTIRRLSSRLEPESIDHLCTVMTADAFGRPPRPPVVPRVVSLLLAKAAELRVRERAPEAILLGRHLLRLGMVAGPEVGLVLRRAYDAQLEGSFADLDGALQWLVEDLKESNPIVSAKARVARAESM